ncbi:MAG: hypothetical protein P8X90_15820 [Desulfobacterales bacterium]
MDPILVIDVAQLNAYSSMALSAACDCMAASTTFRASVKINM